MFYCCLVCRVSVQHVVEMSASLGCGRLNGMYAVHQSVSFAMFSHVVVWLLARSSTGRSGLRVVFLRHLLATANPAVSNLRRSLAKTMFGCGFAKTCRRPRRSLQTCGSPKKDSISFQTDILPQNLFVYSLTKTYPLWVFAAAWRKSNTFSAPKK